MRRCPAIPGLVVAGLVLVGLVGGCGGGPAAPAPPVVLPRPSFDVWGPPGPAPPVVRPPSSATSRSPSPSPGRSRPVSTGWEITVYYTAVEALHDGEPARVTGCPGLDCAHGDDDLGTYPADFVAAVRSEGTGRTVAGRYLNWSYDIGF